MAEQHRTETIDPRVSLPVWLQCMVALFGTALLAGPVAAVVWYR